VLWINRQAHSGCKYKKQDLLPGQWEDLGKKLRAISTRLTVSIKYHSEYGERFEIKKQGLPPAQFSRVNLLGQLVRWEP
jgi:hypothetical protein